MDVPQEDEDDSDYDSDEAECNEPSVKPGSSSFLLVSLEPAFTERCQRTKLQEAELCMGVLTLSSAETEMGS